MTICTNPKECWYPMAKGKPVKFTFKPGMDMEYTHGYMPCGQCYNCHSRKVADRATKLYHEIQTSTASAYTTFTFNEDHVHVIAEDIGNHEPLRQMQLLVKRLRKKEPRLRCTYTFEFGERTKRPHYHAIFTDCDKLLEGAVRVGPKLWDAPAMISSWSYGWVQCDSTPDIACCQYVCDYMQAETMLKMPVNPKTGRRPRTYSASNNAGMKWVDKYYTDILGAGAVVVKDGGKRTVPKSYLKKRPELFEPIIKANLEYAQKQSLEKCIEEVVEENRRKEKNRRDKKALGRAAKKVPS